jgi:hypothetical protein
MQRLRRRWRRTRRGSRRRASASPGRWMTRSSRSRRPSAPDDVPPCSRKRRRPSCGRGRTMACCSSGSAATVTPGRRMPRATSPLDPGRTARVRSARSRSTSPGSTVSTTSTRARWPSASTMPNGGVGPWRPSPERSRPAPGGSASRRSSASATIARPSSTPAGCWARASSRSRACRPRFRACGCTRRSAPPSAPPPAASRWASTSSTSSAAVAA